MLPQALRQALPGGAAIVFLVVAGPWLLGDRISMAGIWALVAALGLIIGWIVYQSRRY